MYIKFRTRTTSRIRILAFCMALMICWMSVVHGFRVYGETYDISDGESNIKTSGTNGSTKNTSNGIARATSGDLSYTYTGEMYVDGSVSLYDYLSDKEIIGESIYSKASGYTDAYTILNSKISQSGASKYPASGNITITYTPSASESEVFKASLKRIWVHLWNSSDKTNKATGWPGIVMEYNNSTNKFECTVNRNMLNFDPNCLIIHDYKGNESNTIEQPLLVQHTYNFKTDASHMLLVYNSNRGDPIYAILQDSIVSYPSNANQIDTSGFTSFPRIGTNSSNYHYNMEWDTVKDYLTMTDKSWQTPNKLLRYDEQQLQLSLAYKINGGGTVLEPPHPYVKLDSTDNTAKELNGSAYDTPLYFGCLYKETAYLSYKAPYDNFYWQANIAQRGTGTNSASVQGLVNYDLNGVPTQNSTPVNLPFFTDGKGTAFDGIIKGYDGLQFPFYQIKAQANLIKGNDNSSSHYAKFYQFNAKETNVQLAKDEKNHYSIVESDVQISSQKSYQGDRTVGFFPFNTTNSTDDDAPTNNLGFGAVFTVDFYLNP